MKLQLPRLRRAPHIIAVACALAIVVSVDTPALHAQAPRTAANSLRSTQPVLNPGFRDLISTGAIAQPPAPDNPPVNIGFVPRHEQLAIQQANFQELHGAEVVDAGTVVGEDIGYPIVGEHAVGSAGDIHYEHDYQGEFVDGVGGGACGDGGCCGDMGCNRCGHGLPFLGRIEAFAGAHAFTGPVNRGETSSFGVHEGLNWSRPLWHLTNGLITGQLGLRAAQSNFSGSTLADKDRQQLFVTGGIFRRSDWGLQGGIAFDYLNDSFFEDIALTQLRGELSWKFPTCQELGFWFTANTGDEGVSRAVNDRLTLAPGQWQATDIFAFFYRRQFWKPGAEGRFYVSLTGGSDALIGGDIRVPLTSNLALRNSVTYLIPSDSDGLNGPANEAWNVALTLVWTPGCGCGFDYARPLLDVADNGSFIIDRR